MADNPESAIGVCSRDIKASAGKSEIGETPFLDGFNAFVNRVFGGSGGWLATALSAISTVVLAPVKWFADLCGLLAHVFAYGLEAVFIPSSWVAFALGDLVDPALLAAALLVVILRFATLPLLMASSTQSVKLALTKPAMQAAMRKHANNKQQQAVEMQKLQRAVGVNPIGCVPRIALIVVMISGLWKLLQGMTVRSTTGTFAPNYIHSDTDLYRHLAGLHDFTSFGMNMTRSIPQVGYCSIALPYFGSLILVLAVVALSLGPMWRYRRKFAGAIIVMNLFAVAFLPALLIILRIGDGLATWFHSRYLLKYRKKVELELRTDPDFVRSMGELATDFLPSQDTTNPPSRHTDPPDVPPHR
ncbi:YidC/Oxa1 family membrane protein insertase [Amycolatopsis japonica]|uniref:YidC/Oxa1 family membrane protein insertase n=1 Tax=Amycolatopsis japonica TaxID=208439 RepID=UPI0033E0147E